jgi:hypothetical protein
MENERARQNAPGEHAILHKMARRSCHLKTMNQRRLPVDYAMTIVC